MLYGFIHRNHQYTIDYTINIYILYVLIVAYTLKYINHY